MEEINKKPSIRFADFTDAWEQRKLKDESIYIVAGGDIDKSKLNESGSYPVIANALTNDGIVGYYASDFRIDAPAVTVTGRGDVGHAVARKCNFTPIVRLLSIKTSHDVDFLTNNINLKGFVVESTGVPQLTVPKLEDLLLYFPKQISEEVHIGNMFVKINELITLHQRKCDQLSNVKKALLEKMFPSDGEYTPKIRFKGFTDVWEQRKLIDETSVITKQTGFDYSSTIKPALVTEKNNDNYPFIQNKDFDGKNINYNTDFYIPISVAHKFPKITLDSPSLLITISGKIGNIGYFNDKTIAFIGGAVGICKLKKDNGLFITYSLLSQRGQRYFNSLVKASSHANITVEDIRNIEYLCPSDNNEELKIVKLFDNIDNLITIHQRE